MASSEISLEAVPSVSDIKAEEWDACANPQADPDAIENLDTLASPGAQSCSTAGSSVGYNPFVSYADVQNNPARMANIMDFSQLSTDLAANSVPDYTWISPDQCNDMHGRGAPATDPCSFSNEQQLIATGDAFLQNTVGQIMNSQAWTGNSVIFITWDESDFPFNDTSGCCDAVPQVFEPVVGSTSACCACSSLCWGHCATPA